MSMLMGMSSIIIFSPDCGKARRGTRIISGRPTEVKSSRKNQLSSTINHYQALSCTIKQVNEYPWMTGLGVKGSLSPMCGAALVSDQFLLTAAHCCYGSVPCSCSCSRSCSCSCSCSCSFSQLLIVVLGRFTLFSMDLRLHTIMGNGEQYLGCQGLIV